jgi:hypothetical protein
MGALLVVGDHPIVDEFADFGEGAEEVGVEDLVAEGAVEALDVGVLGGLAGLDVVEADVVVLAPGDKLGGDELGAVVDADLPGQRMVVCPEDSTFAMFPNRGSLQLHLRLGQPGTRPERGGDHQQPREPQRTESPPPWGACREWKSACTVLGRAVDGEVAHEQ